MKWKDKNKLLRVRQIPNIFEQLVSHKYEVSFDLEIDWKPVQHSDFHLISFNKMLLSHEYNLMMLKKNSH